MLSSDEPAPPAVDVVGPQSDEAPLLTAPGPAAGMAPSACIIPTMSSSPQPSTT